MFSPNVAPHERGSRTRGYERVAFRRGCRRIVTVLGEIAKLRFLRLGFSAEQLIKHHRRRDSTALLQSCNYAARYLLTAHLYLNVELKAIRRLY